MSAARVFWSALAALGLLAAAAVLAPEAARAERVPVVVVRVGGELSARAGQYIDVPITVDLTGAPGRTLGGYRLRLLYNPAVLSFSSTSAGNFAEPYVAYDSAYSTGVLRFTAIQPSGATGIVTLFVVRFYVYSDVAPSNITLDVQELTEAGTFADLLPLAQVVNGTFCKSLGTWGDVDSDGSENSRDALVALSVVVGLAVDTTTMNPSLADVDADGRVTSRDALIILSFAVGLPVTGFRVGLTAAGACATGSATTLVVVPDSVDLQSGQRVKVLVQARDAAGRVVPAGSVAWTSSNTSVASFVDDYNPGIDARDPGVATLTAQLGPGVRGTIKVVVLARRRNWYVDVQRAYNVVTQVGSQGFPFAFIGDAMEDAFDGDTVHVAAGQYDERVSNYTSVVLLGDSLNRPIIDQRGSSYYYPYYSTISAGSAAAKMEIAHFVVRGGGIYVEGHDNIVRDVRIEMLGGSGRALEVYSQAFVPGAPRPALGTASPLRDLGEVLVDGAVVTGYLNYGIQIDQADTATVRSSSVTRDSVSTAYCYLSPYSAAGIMVRSANASDIRNNVVTNAACVGVGAFQETGRAVISRNRVTRASATGIGASAPVVALDHNVMRSIALGGYPYNYSYGAFVSGYNAVDTVRSTGDSVVGVRSNYAIAGLRVDTALVGIVDSLVADSIGVDAAYYGNGLSFEGRRLTVTNSRITTTRENGIEAFGRLIFTSRGNRIRSVLNNGIWVTSSCECSVGGPDSVFSTRDTVSNSSYLGYAVSQAKYVRVDSAVVDTVTVFGAWVASNGRVLIRDSRIRDAAQAGIFVEFGVNRVDIVRDSVLGSGINGVDVYLMNATSADSATITGTTVDATAAMGIYLRGSGTLVADSNRITNNLHGIEFSDGTLGVVSARITRNKVAGNRGYGVALGYSASSVSASLQGNNIQGNDSAGVVNYAIVPITVDADSNYWGDPNGPRCRTGIALIALCSGTSVNGDSITTDFVNFAPYNSAPNASAPTAPPARSAVAAAASRTAPSSLLRSGASMVSRGPPVVGAAAVPGTHPTAERHPFPTAWQRGREPRAPRLPREPTTP